MAAKLRLEAKAFRIRRAALASRSQSLRDAVAANLAPKPAKGLWDAERPPRELPGGPRAFRSPLGSMSGSTHSLAGAGDKDRLLKRQMPEGWRDTTTIGKGKSGKDRKKRWS